MPKSSTSIRNKITVPDLLRKLLAGWLLAVAAEYWRLPGSLRDLAGLEGLAQMSFLRVVIAACLAGAFLLLFSAIANTVRIERLLIAGAVGALMIGALLSSFTWPLFGICALLSIWVTVYVILGWNGEQTPTVQPKKSRKLSLWSLGAMAAAFFLFVSLWLVTRVRSFSTPTYDFGIFAQMFHHMKQSGLPLTTLERDGLLSHFAVHVSPIYYLMLPVYWLFPFPETLQVLQAAVLASAVIPLWKIGKHHGLSDWQCLLICALLLLYPAFAGGTSYDIHENCFLTPLILWLFYGIDRKNTAITAVAALLTLCVKEDAAVYVAVIALWLVIKTALRFKKSELYNLFTGIALLAISLCWFFLVTGYLAKSGDGVMTYRYQNFMYDGNASLMAVIQSVILNPMKAVYECMDKEKLSFIIMTLLPLLGLPLITRRYERYLLLIPYLLVNLMSDYLYQHDIFFQYTFGSTAFLFYLTVINLADLKPRLFQFPLLSAAAIVAAVCFCTSVMPRAIRYPRLIAKHHEHYQQVRDVLDTIPKDAPVAANTFYTTYLSQRDVVYDLRYCSREHFLDCEYVVIRLADEADFKKFSTNNEDNGYENLCSFMEKYGYEPYASLDGVLEIYRKA